MIAISNGRVMTITQGTLERGTVLVEQRAHFLVQPLLILIVVNHRVKLSDRVHVGA